MISYQLMQSWHDPSRACSHGPEQYKVPNFKSAQLSKTLHVYYFVQYVKTSVNYTQLS